MEIIIHPHNKWNWSDTHPLFFARPNEVLTMVPYCHITRSNLGLMRTELRVMAQTHAYREFELDQSVRDLDLTTGRMLEKYDAESVVEQIQDYRSIVRKLAIRYRHTSALGQCVREGVSLFFGQERFLRAVA